MAKWSSEKNELLKRTRGISFEEIIEAASTDTLDDYEHPNKKKYPNQRIAVKKFGGRDGKENPNF